MLPDSFQTNRLVLRPITVADAGAIYAAYARNAEVTRFLIWRPHRTLSDFEAYVAHLRRTVAACALTYGLQWEEGQPHARRVSICAKPTRIGWSSATYWRAPGGGRA